MALFQLYPVNKNVEQRQIKRKIPRNIQDAKSTFCIQEGGNLTLHVLSDILLRSKPFRHGVVCQQFNTTTEKLLLGRNFLLSTPRYIYREAIAKIQVHAKSFDFYKNIAVSAVADKVQTLYAKVNKILILDLINYLQLLGLQVLIFKLD